MQAQAGNGQSGSRSAPRQPTQPARFSLLLPVPGVLMSLPGRRLRYEVHTGGRGGYHHDQQQVKAREASPELSLLVSLEPDRHRWQATAWVAALQVHSLTSWTNRGMVPAAPK
jgi:hypothetical protein